MKKIVAFLIFIAANNLLPAQVPASGLVAYWPMDGSFADSGPNAINGTNQGATATTNNFSVTNTAMSFSNPTNTVAQFAIHPINANLSFGASQDFSVDFSFYITSPFVFAGGLYDNNLNYAGCGIFLWNVNGFLQLNMNFKNGNIETTNGALTADTWYHVCCIRSSGTMKIYINGVLNVSGSEGVVTPIYNFPARFGTMFFNGYTPGEYNGFTGKMDEMRIYNRALTDQEVLQLYNAYISGNITRRYVNDNNTTGDVFTSAVGNDLNGGTAVAPFATLTKAINTAVAGDTIFVDAGTYTEPDIIVNKGITILGSNYLISPNDLTDALQSNNSRNAESMIPNCKITIGSANINIKGFSFDPQSKTQIEQTNTGNDFDNITVSKNIFYIKSGSSVINLSGRQVNPLVTFNYTVTDNRFIKVDANGGTSINISKIDGITIQKNTFTVSSDIANRTEFCINNGTFRSNNVVINQNIAYRQNNLFQGISALNARIDFNKAIECNRFGVASNNLNDPCIIDITDNIVTDPKGLAPSIGYARNTGSNLTSPNIARLERNTVTVNATGTTGTPQALIAPSLDNVTQNCQLFIRDNKLKFTGDFSLQSDPLAFNAGIRYLNNIRQTVVERNEIEFDATNFNGENKAGIAIYHFGLTSGTQFDILNNKISGFNNSVVIQQNDPNSATGLGALGQLPAGVTVNINNNSFTNDIMSINNGTVSQEVQATCNWYGTTDVEVLATKLSTETGQYLPWLVNGTDNDPVTTGFQPVPGSCTGRITKWYINDNSLTGDVFTTAVGNDENNGVLKSSPFATLNAALTNPMLQAGDTILIDAGTYNFAPLTINQSVTILGANYNVSPNDATDPLLPNAGRHAESIINFTQLTIAAANIRVNGFAFSPGAASQFQQTNTALDFDNIDLSKNIFHITSGSTMINLSGKQINPLVTFNYSITDNRFIKEDANGGTAINISKIDGITIQNNTFTVSSDIANRTETCLALGSFRSNNVVINQNIAYRQNNLFSGISALNARIDFNKAIECNRFGIASNNLNDPCIIDITDNIVTDPKGLAPSITYSRNSGVNLTSPNIARIERNTVTVNATGTTGIPQALISPVLDNLTQNCQVFIRDNKLKFTGDFSLQSDPLAFNAGIRFLNNSRQAVVERNEIEFNATNFNGENKAGIAIYHFGLTGGTQFDIFNNKISGFNNSVVIQQNDPNSATGLGALGQLPAGVIVNINNNSFTNDVMSINNGTQSQTVISSCNWYGSAAVQNFINKLTSSTVDIVPWLINGTDNDAATGFQPVSGACDGYPTLVTLDSYTNVSCSSANNGAINITATLGKAPFTYTWIKDGDPLFISHDEDLINLSPGIYHLSIVDGNGSNIYITSTEADGPGTIDITITEPPLLTANASGTNVSCYGGSNGSASVTSDGGTLPYTYLWSNGSTDVSISNLSAGIYSVTVTDGNGCTKSASYEVTQPAVLTATASGSNVSCFGGSNGTASVTVGGGTLPYTYLWSNGGSSQSISGLTIGIYTVTVTDGNGCTKSSSYQVTQPTLLVVNLTGTSASCNGSATATVSGGTLPYTYLWSNGATTASINNVPAGLYSVTVTDAHNCIASGSYTIVGSSPINPITSLVPVSCFGGSNGSITITGTSSGTAPFTYNLNGSSFQTGNTFSNLAAGVYVVGIKDANGCSDFVSRTINQPLAPLTVVLDSLKQSCSGASTGRIFITPSGGTGGKTYSWTGPNGFTSTAQDPNNIAAGNYSVLVKDANGCSFNLNVTLPEYPVINVSADITNVLCFGAATGSIDITVTGGSGSGFTYLWNNGATTQDRFNLTVGNNYRITVTDIGSGCAVSRRDTVRGPASAVTVTVPNQNIINVSGCNSPGSFTAQGSGGTQYSAPDPYRYSINGFNYQTSPVFNNLQAGSYTVTIKDVNGCMATKAVTITDNGSDEYEGAPNNTGNNNNNAKGKAAPISPGTAISARIGIAGDLDYYKLGTANLWTGNYTIAFVQPSIAVTFDLVASNGTTIIAPTSSSATYKQYNGLNGTYYVRVSGTNSLSCYQFTISSGIITRSSGSNIQPEVTKAQMKDGSFDVKVLGNPSSTSFIMNVITNSEEKISMRVFDAQGRLIEQRQGLQPIETLRIGERYINGVYMAEIRQGKNIKTIRLVKM